jgi:hypothetical protein
MKRVIGPGLLGLGVFLLVVAALVRFYAAPALVKIPLDQDVISVSEATDASYFDIGSLSVKTGQNIRATRQIQGDVSASSADTVVFKAYVTVANADGTKFSESTDRVALDRRTAHAVNCCDEEVDGDDTRHTGLSYTFPIGTERKTYQFFDTAARKAFPMEYRATDTVKGLTTYKFEQKIDEQVIDQQTLPGAILGQPSKLLLTADMVYSNVRTVWVEPSTGAIVKGQEEQLRVLRAEGGPDTTVFEATVAFTDQAVDEAVARAEDGIGKAKLITSTVPLVAFVLGVVLALLGALGTAMARRPRQAEARAEARQAESSQV